MACRSQWSFSTDPNPKGAPTEYMVPVREARLAGEAEFPGSVTGEVLTMPDLPRIPAANRIHLNDQGEIEGLPERRRERGVPRKGHRAIAPGDRARRRAPGRARPTHRRE